MLDGRQPKESIQTLRAGLKDGAGHLEFMGVDTYFKKGSRLQLRCLSALAEGSCPRGDVGL